MLAADSQLEDDAVVFAALPLFHVNALVVTLLASLLRGREVVWAGPLGYRDPALFGNFWKIVEHYGVAMMSAVPRMYAALARCPVDADITSLRVAYVGAAPPPPAVRDSFEASTGVSLLEGYGLTEATCASARSFTGAARPGSVGQRLAYQQIRIVKVQPDGRWQDMPRGETGLVAISGPTVFPGYVVGNDEHGHRLNGLGKLVDGWLDTGDLGRIDDDGFVYLAGRAKDLIIRGGHNIDPAITEDALLAHPQVTAASAIGRPDVHAGEVPVAYATVVPGSSVTEDELCVFAAGLVAERGAAPKEVTVLDALPVTAVGKPYKLALRADATRRAFADALSGLCEDVAIATEIVDGSVVATVEVGPDDDLTAVNAVLDQYAVASRVRCRRDST
jgi:fatty-acyl-CoA synthase